MFLKTLQSLNTLLQVVWPVHCWFCKHPVIKNNPNAEQPPFVKQRLCAACLERFNQSLNGEACYRCALPLNTANQQLLCAQCLQSPPAFDQTVAIYNYQGLVSDLILQAKKQLDSRAQNLLCHSFTHQILKRYQPNYLPQALLFVPSHTRTLRLRPSYLAYYLARHAFKAIGKVKNKSDSPMVWAGGALIKAKPTKPQQKLKREQRLTNIQSSVFQQTQALPFRHIALVDDVMTTTTTMASVARLLKSKNPTIKQIDAWVLARSSQE